VGDTRIRQVEEIFLGATELDSSQWKQFLDERCGPDPQLRAEVESLLQSHRSDDEFLDSDDAPGKVIASQLTNPPVEDEEPPLPKGYQIGTYAIDGILGRGGMGIVYLARQERPRRTVALKVMRRGVSSERLLRRFEYEAEVLGRLQHPGIAQIYEAGVWRDPDRGWHRRPYIAMELVRGKPLTDFCDEKQMDVRQRLELFARVCDAVQHAHQMGVIHRDLKPGNIFVDESGNPKILDFGVARTSGDSQMTSVHTAVGQLIGTLQYMSPEQVVSAPEEIDTRSDVYALGVVLFQVLTGRLPYDVKNKPLPEAARMITEDAAPRLSSIDRLLRGDIEICVGRALEKDRVRRYQSAADLSADIRRFLQGLPLTARDDSSWYLLRSYMRRYRAFVALAAAAFLGIVSAGIVAIVQASRADVAKQQAETESRTAIGALTKAQEEKDRAEAASARADKAASDLTRQLRESTIERGRLLSVTGNLSAAEDLIWPEYFSDPSSRLAKWAMWEMYSREPLLRTFGPQGVISRTCNFVPNTHDLVVGFEDGSVGMYDAETAVERWNKPKAHAREIMCATVSERGDFFVVASIDGDIQVRRTSDGELIQRITTYKGVAYSLVLGFEDRLMFVAGNGTAVSVYDMLTGELVRTIDGNRRTVVSLAITPDSRFLAVGGSDLTFRVIDLQRDECVHQFSAHLDAVNRLAFSPDGEYLVSGGRDRFVSIHQVTSGRLISRFDSRNGTIRALRFQKQTGSGPPIVTVGGWWSTQNYDAETGRFVSQIAAGTFGIDYSDDGLLMVTAGFGVKTWELLPNRCKTTLIPGNGAVSAVAFSSDDSLLVTGSFTNGELSFWDRATGKLIETVASHSKRVRSIAFSPNGQLLASASLDGSIRVWNVRTRRVERVIDMKAALNGVEFLSDDRRVVVCGQLGDVSVWDVLTGKKVARMMAESDEMTSLAISADRSLLATVSRVPDFSIWDLRTMKRIVHEPVNVAAWSVAMNPGGTALALGTWVPALEFLQVGETVPRAIRTEHQALIASMAFSPDGSFLVTGAGDGSLRLWDAKTYSSLATFAGHEGSVFGVAFSRTGRWFASVGSDGAVFLWDLTYYDRHIQGNMEYRQAASPRTLPRVPDGYRRR
jgi:eukaryotic-like serine/threonine-protein kinase